MFPRIPYFTSSLVTDHQRSCLLLTCVMAILVRDKLDQIDVKRKNSSSSIFIKFSFLKLCFNKHFSRYSRKSYNTSYDYRNTGLELFRSIEYFKPIRISIITVFCLDFVKTVRWLLSDDCFLIETSVAIC